MRDEAVPVEEPMDNATVDRLEDKPFDGYTEPPIPYNEADIPESERDWVPDYHDQLVPERRSFISDFVFHTRGIMTPTLMCIWSSLYLMQAVIKREAWLQWFPKPLYSNQYMIVIGPAGKVKKTTAVSFVGLPILKKVQDFIRDRNIYHMKYLTIIKDKTTPEAMISAMLPENKEGSDFYLQNEDGTWINDEEGRAIRYTKTAEASIMISELAVTLSKKSYAESLVEILLDLYDCHDEWEWRREGKGTKTLPHICTSLIGGTTVDGFRSSIPRAAKGDGFVSRTVLIYTPTSKRVYSMPFLPRGAPSEDEMAKRLAWIAEHTLGEFTLSADARTIYDKWYIVYNKRMEDAPDLAAAVSRMDINILKTAMLIRAARYEAQDMVIDAQDMLDSIRLVETTYKAVPYLMSQLEDDLILSLVGKTEVYMQTKKRVRRCDFLGSLRMRSDVATMVMQEMIARGEIYVLINGKKGLQATGRSDEEYVWIEPTGERAKSFEEIWNSESYFDSTALVNSPPRGKGSAGKPHGLAAVSPRNRRGRKKLSDASAPEGES